jgi:hypothetical protein
MNQLIKAMLNGTVTKSPFKTGILVNFPHIAMEGTFKIWSLYEDTLDF